VLGRLNGLVSEPSNAPGSASRFFVNDLNGVLYILDKKTKKFIPYIVFPEVFPRMDTERFASGIVTIQFDPDYAHNGKFYTVHTEVPENSGSPMPTNAKLPALNLTGYTTTPIVNPPQSGILGMHAIQERPIALAGNVVIRPMMFIALTYDHRIVDGREAVSFLKRIKDAIESPARMLIEV
jgi:hypothetical protein